MPDEEAKIRYNKAAKKSKYPVTFLQVRQVHKTQKYNGMRILIPQWHIHNQKCVGEVNHWLEQRVNVLLSEVYLKWFLTASVAQAAVWA